MSALGQKQTLAGTRLMSALPQKPARCEGEVAELRGASNIRPALAEIDAVMKAQRIGTLPDGELEKATSSRLTRARA